VFVLKKDAIKRLFLCLKKKPKGQLLCSVLFTLLCSSNYSLANSDVAADCRAPSYHETAQLRYIHDGDTLHLQGGRKLRLIGINTPELATKKHSAEAYSEQAKRALMALFKDDKTIALVFGKDKKDHYGRYLAHAFTSSGRNAQASLLSDGYGYALQIPPNTAFAACYLGQEKKARCNKRGLWKNSAIIPATELSTKQNGFHLVAGTIVNININKKGIWLNLDNRLTVGIRNDQRALFDEADIKKLLHQNVVVRGWLNRSKRETPFYMRIKHPLALQKQESFTCPALNAAVNH